MTTLSFDIAALELFLPLVEGATVILASREETLDPRALAELLVSSAATVMQATPATWQLLIDSGWQGDSELRALCGGEALSPTLATELLTRTGQLWNMYGPTETTIWSMVDRVLPGRPVTLGQPIADTTVRAIGRNGTVVPDGAVGELVLGGAGVSRGYWGRADLTADRFSSDPVSGERWYRTGDLVRITGDEVLFVGRSDDQVKVRGFRVELGEVETALLRCPGVQRAAAVVRTDSGVARLVGYLVPRPGVVVDAAEIRRLLGGRLPEYMVPSVIMVVSEFPLTQNGKLNRLALPVPVVTASDEYREPQGRIEEAVARIWRTALGAERVGADDNIFDLGADSLTVARVYAAVGDEFGVRLPLAPAFQAPTVAQLAALVEQASSAAEGLRGFSALAPLRATGSRPPLFLVHGGAGTILLYEPLTRMLGDDQPVYGLQAVGLYGVNAPQRSVAEMARRYVTEMRAVQPEGPYQIGGYCYGALVAYEMAVQLAAAGQRTSLLVSFNGPSPAYLKRYRPLFDGDGAVNDENGRPLRRTGPLSSAAAGSAPSSAVAGSARSVSVARRTARTGYRLTRRRIARVRRSAEFAWYLRRGQPLPARLREASGFQRLAAIAQDEYQPTRYDGTMVVIQGAGLYHQPGLLWEAHAADVVTYEVPGFHRTPRLTMAQPHAGVVAAELRRMLTVAEAEATANSEADADSDAG